MSIIGGMMLIGAGLMVTLKSEWLVNNIGRIAIFEKFLGMSGGTRLGYKMIGMLVAFIGFLYMTNLLGLFLNWIFGPVTNIGLPQ